MRDEMNEAWKVAGRSARWFAKNYPVIASFGALASVQRFVAVRGVRGGAWAAGVTGELLTAAARIGAVGLVRQDGVRGLSGAAA